MENDNVVAVDGAGGTGRTQNGTQNMQQQQESRVEATATPGGRTSTWTSVLETPSSARLPLQLANPPPGSSVFYW